ncbi:hypothetical protein SKAU_G00019200 [Synaphobranchus kaupii]|uniref:Uncharacterized protein n=1 Tax=Synaphobranchus kaupii TaxID=118154 RepID=A0A9Q1GBX4_SYNKA|nr:hypothetical protein SKAU_G00019200 [Synaphobranchus kaupii]
MLSDRLKTLTVPDLLLCPSGNDLSEDVLFRYCLPFEETGLADAERLDPGLSETQVSDAERRSPGLTEEFCHVPVLQEESLMLPLKMESCHPRKQCRASPRRELQKILEIVPEQIEKDSSCQDILRKDIPASLWVSVEISDFKIPEEAPENVPRGGPLFPLDLSHPVHCRLYPRLETDLPLTPPRLQPSPHAQLFSAALAAEQMSPVYRHRLMSDCAREGVEEALWEAEKHLPVVLSLLLAEPQMSEPTLHYQPVSEAFKLMTSEGECNGRGQGDTGNANLQTGFLEVAGFPKDAACSRSKILEIFTEDHSQFVERMEDCGTTELNAAFTEDFLPFSFSQIDSCPGYPVTPTALKDRSAPSAMTDVLGSSCQDMQKSNKGIAIEETATNQGVEPDPVGGSVRGGRIFLVQEERGVHRSIHTSRPEEDLDPLSSFIMLRSQKKASVGTLPQNSTCRDPNLVIEAKEELKPRVDLKLGDVTSAGRGNDVRAQETSSITRPEARDGSQVICVQASD